MFSSESLRQIRGRALLLVSLGLACADAQAAPQYTRRNALFLGDSGPYHSYYQPALVHGSGTVLLAFCEGRKEAVGDYGTTKDLVYKISTNNGGTGTWGGLIVLATAQTGESYMNPTAVYEPSWTGGPAKGRIHLFFNKRAAGFNTTTNPVGPGDVKVMYTYSDNDGAAGSWAAFQDKTNDLKLVTAAGQLAFDLVGPGNGIRRAQSAGGHVGQLVVPALSRNFVSNNHGSSWQMFRCPPTANDNDLTTNEPTITETLAGTLVRNDRAKGRVVDGLLDSDGTTPAPAEVNNRRRWLSYGTPESGFSLFAPKDALLDPRMTGASLRYNFNAPDRILFLNSSSTVNDWNDTNNDLQQEGRGRMKVYISYDDGATWPISRFLYSQTVPESGTVYANIGAAQAAGRGGGSSMTKLNDATYGVGALVVVNENGLTSTGHRSIDFHRFNIEWIVGSATEPTS